MFGKHGKTAPVRTDEIDPSPADDFLEEVLDLNQLIIKHPEATFFARVEGDSMKDEGITEGDMLVVDKAVRPYDGCLAVSYIDG